MVLAGMSVSVIHDGKLEILELSAMSPFKVESPEGSILTAMDSI